MFEEVLHEGARCPSCLHYSACQMYCHAVARQNSDAEECPEYYALFSGEPTSKICPFRHDNVQLGSASCLGSDCAWWDAANNNCVVFRVVWDSADSLSKEIDTVLYGGIIQGGED